MNRKMDALPASDQDYQARHAPSGESPYQRDQDESDEGEPVQANASQHARRTSSTRKSSSTAADGGVSRRSRPRASLACMHCRQRKVKCHMDAGRTPCSSCQALQIPCVISRDGDRRKAGSREQVTALQDRVQFLESLVTRNSGLDTLPEDGSSQQEDAGPEGPVTIRAASHSRPPPSLERASSSTSDHVSNYQPGTNNMDSALSNMSVQDQSGRWNYGHASASQMPNRSLSTPASGQDAFNSPTSGLTPPSEKDGSRLDVDQDHGQIRFYGPTSQPYIRSRDVPDDGDMHPSGHVAMEVDLDSEPVKNLLLDIFWKTHHLTQPFVQQPVFEQGRRASARSEHYSPFLENSILACATRMSTSRDIRLLGSKYAERATSDVAHELQYPNVATLQGYLLLSDFESTRGRNRLGYMYCGMGCRLAFDLGLAESCVDMIAQGRLTLQESIFRHTLLLATFVYDKLWGYYLGRPSAIPDSYLATAEQRMAEQGWKVPPRFDAWVGLCKEISEATEILNNAAPLDANSMHQIVDLDHRICTRQKTLDLSLALHDDRPSMLAPDAYGLHVQMLGLRTVLHRTLSKAISHSSHASMGIPSPQDNENINRSRTIMHDNAIRIARLISVYQQIFGIENIITIMLDNMFIAAAVLISHVVQYPNTPTAEQDMQWLRIIADTLQKAQKHYPVTARMRSTLSGSVDKTPLAGMFGHWAHANVNAPPGQVQPDPMHGTLQPIEIFGNGNEMHGMVPHHAGQDLTLMENPFGDYGVDPGMQDMDLRNMMSWVLSPPVLTNHHG